MLAILLLLFYQVFSLPIDGLVVYMEHEISFSLFCSTIEKLSEYMTLSHCIFSLVSLDLCPMLSNEINEKIPY